MTLHNKNMYIEPINSGGECLHISDESEGQPSPYPSVKDRVFTTSSSSCLFKISLAPMKNRLSYQYLVWAWSLVFLLFFSFSSSSVQGQQYSFDDLIDLQHRPSSIISKNTFLSQKHMKNYGSSYVNDDVSVSTIEVGAKNCVFPSSELTTLEWIYNSTGGSKWTWTGHIWNFTEPNPNPCVQKWQGIKCIEEGTKCTVNSLTLSNNNMVGTLPSEIGNFLNISLLEIKSNYGLRGVLPSQIGKLHYLQTIQISNTGIGGSIPSSFGNLINLQTLQLNRNYFVGSLPNTIGNMSNLVTLDLERNRFTGSFPNSFYELKKMEVLYIRQNRFSGSISEKIGNLKLIYIMDIDRNRFVGSLPSTMSELTKMVYFYCYFNGFTGSLPAGISGWKELIVFSIDANYFTGAVPDMSDCTPLQFLRLDANKFQKTIPNMFFKMENISLLNFSSNFFSGTIPSSIGHSMKLTSLDFSNNNLQGTIGTVVANIPALEQVIFNNNRFTGTLDNFVNAMFQHNLTIVDVSNNQFTGQLPLVVFDLPILSVFAATKNCFKGYIPYNICKPKQTIISYVLSGLHTADSCQQQIYYDVDTYFLSGPLRGDLPSCLWTDLEVIQTLDLSGNGILGTIPDIEQLPKSLTSMSLSHNRLTGTIPEVIQSHTWTTLDLSFNKLSGHLVGTIYDFVALNTSIALRVNRLSGTIPDNLLQAYNIKVLEGNMFTCDQFDRTTLPTNDPFVDSYSCGSDATNTTFILWLICMVIFLLFLFISSRSFLHSFAPNLNSIKANIFNYYAIFQSTEYPAFHEYGITMREIRRWVGTLTAVVVVLLMPVYYTLSLFYGTYESQYAWNVSIAFISGQTAAIMMLCFFLVLLYAFYSKYCRRFFVNIPRILDVINAASKVETVTERISLVDDADSIVKDIRKFYKWYLIVIVILVFNGGVVMTVNMVFVYAMSTDISVALKQLITISVSLFKVGWNGVVINMMYDEMKKSLEGFNITPKEELEKRMRLTALMLWVSIFNSIMAPLLAIAFISVDCFYLTIVPSPNITSNISFFQCIDNPTVLADGTVTVDNSCGNGYFVSYEVFYSPQYTYSYQCISTLLTNFANVFLYRYIFNGIIQPVLLILLKWLQESLFEKYGPNSPLFQFITLALPTIMAHTNLPKNANGVVSSLDMHTVSSVGRSRPSYIERLEAALPETSRPSVQNTDVIAGDPENLEMSVFRRQVSIRLDSMAISSQMSKVSTVINTYLEFNMYSIIISFATDIAIFMTFGVIFPPLAIVAWTTMVLQTIFVQLCLGRVVFLSKSQPSLTKFVEDLSNDCAGVSALLVKCMSSLATLILFIWSWFLLDMLADELALRRSIWIFFMLPAFRFGVVLVEKIIRKRCGSKAEEEVDRLSKDDTGGRSTYGGDIDVELKSIAMYAPDSDDDEDNAEVLNPISSASSSPTSKKTENE